MAKKVFGIKINYSPNFSSKQKTGLFIASFYIDKGIPSKNFISSREIRDAIKKFRETNGTNLGRKIGYISFEVFQNSIGWGIIPL